MKKTLFMIMAFLLAFTCINAVITYSSVTSTSAGKFITYTGLTTVAVADTAANHILSPVFTYGSQISNKGIMVTGVVVAALQHSVNVAVGKVKATLQVSSDGTNFADLYSFDAYIGTGATAGKVYIIPASTEGILAPYYRVKWTGYAPDGTIYIADIFGTIRTIITTIP